jgi:hypothetical protein
MNCFQNLAPRFLEKECESRHEIHQLAPMRIISDHGLHPPSRGYGAAGGSHGFVIPSSFAKQFPRAIRQLPDHSNHHNPCHGWPREWFPQTTIRKQLINT